MIERRRRNFFRATRRSYIEAKYVQKVFLRPLPGSNPLRSSSRSIRRWSIVKQSLHTLNISNDTDDDTSLSLKSNNRRLEFLNRSATSFDTDLSIGMIHSSRNQNWTFLSADNSPPIWNVNLYLYEAARHGNVSMMLHALALDADKNYPNPYDHQRTPLIQAVLSVTID